MPKEVNLVSRRWRKSLGTSLSWAFWLAVGSLLAIAPAHAANLFLAMQDDAPSLLSGEWTGYRLVLERSATLTNWQEVASVRNRLWAYPDLIGTAPVGGFYRIAATALQPADDWSNQLYPASGELFTPGSGSGLAATRIAKFSILLTQPDRVFFQDSVLWPYHYHFAVARLPGYAGMSILQYNRQALYANGAGLQAEIASLYGKEVLLVVESTNHVCRITLTDTTGLLTPERRQEILDSKQAGTLDITPVALAGTDWLPVDPLTPADIRYVGGKAANFGFLRRSLPNDTPTPVIVFTFDLWEAYLAQTLSGGQTLRQRINGRLGNHTYPPDVFSLRTNLAAVRNLITDTADFNVTQRAEIVAALQQAGFGGRKIRFRSSTNVEDTDTFNGAGLYDSFSGCLEDDLDGDTRGPSLCDPTEPNERGVFRAMRKVYASFYNENAFLERLRFGVNETNVGMAILVHYSSPDPEELANGVALLSIDKTSGTRQAGARIVTQLGAESVTNPDPTKQPETVITAFTGTSTLGAELVLVTSSSLTTNGAPVMPWEADYRTLLDQLNTATLAYEDYYPAKTAFELDFEFKRMIPGHIGLKQVRAVPHPVVVPPPTIP